MVSEPTFRLSFTNILTKNEYSWWWNLANTFSLSWYVGKDYIELKPFTRLSITCPVKLKRCAGPAETHEWVQQESHNTRAAVTSVLEPISNRSTGRSPVSFLYGGDPATFDDEVWGLIRFGGAVLFEFEWLVLLPMLTSLFPSLALKFFSTPCKKTLWVL